MISFVRVEAYHTSTNEFYPEIMKSVKGLPALLILLLAVSATQAARPLRGIRIVCPGAPVTIYLNEEKVSSPTNSCFIANLKSGDYRIEAYDGYGGNKRGGNPVFSETVRHSRGEITEVNIENRRRQHPGRIKNIPVISRTQFDRLLKMVKEESFDSNKNTLLSMVAGKNRFSTDQIRQILGLYSFDAGKVEALKMCYPTTVDPENYFTLLSTLKFSGSKSELKNFIDGL